jgi:hypothetical protein
MLLPDDLLEGLGSVAAVQRQGGLHARTLTTAADTR